MFFLGSFWNFYS